MGVNATEGKKCTSSLLLKYSKKSQRTGRVERENNSGRYKRENSDPEIRQKQSQALYPRAVPDGAQATPNFAAGITGVPFHKQRHSPKNDSPRGVSTNKSVYLQKYK